MLWASTCRKEGAARRARHFENSNVIVIFSKVPHFYKKNHYFTVQVSFLVSTD
jgi:hypothetical protein